MDPLPKQAPPDRTRGLIDEVLSAVLKLIEETERPYATESPAAERESVRRYADAVLAVEHQRPNMEAAMLDLEKAGYAGRYGVDEERRGEAELPVDDDGSYNDVPNPARIRYFYGHGGCRNALEPYKPTGATVDSQSAGLRKLERALLVARAVCPDERDRAAIHAVAEPKPKHFQAYWFQQAGKSQAEIAEMLKTTQGTISKWVKKVENWRAAGNVMPEIPKTEPLHSKPAAIDSVKLDLGARSDHRAPRQAEKLADIQGHDGEE